MKVELDKAGRYTLSAETEADNTLLFSIVNGVKYNGVTFKFPNKSFSLREIFTRKNSEPVVSQALAEQQIIGMARSTVNAITSELEKDEPREKRKYTRRTPVTTTTKKRPYLKSCPVEGCDHKARGMDLHLRNAHGIHPDGSLHETFQYNGGRGRAGKVAPEQRQVKAPVVKLPNGTYKVRPKRGLLD